MYGIHTEKSFKEFGTMSEALAFAYRSLKQKSYDYTIYDVYKDPAGRVAQIRQDLRDDSGGSSRYIIGVCWVSPSFTPQYERSRNTEKCSYAILPNGKLGKTGWRMIKS
jgi:hypothetical protein